MKFSLNFLFLSAKCFEQLTEKNFHEFLQESEHMLVTFFTPDCKETILRYLTPFINSE